MPALTTQQFIDKANLKHNNKYNYSKVNYKNNKTKIIIICNTCQNEFEQEPRNHLSGYGCIICGNSLKLTTNTFIQKANLIHNNKYNYDKVDYITLLF